MLAFGHMDEVGGVDGHHVEDWTVSAVRLGTIGKSLFSNPNVTPVFGRNSELQKSSRKFAPQDMFLS